MDSPVDSRLRQTASDLANNLPQSLLIFGNDATGLLHDAVAIAGKRLADIIEPRNTKFATDYEKGSIKVDAIRELFRKTAGKSKTERVYIIHPANTMTISAQNAFLKLLEEPPEGTHFILTAASATQLLPTITSRVHICHIADMSHDDSQSILTNKGITDKKLMQQITFLSAGKKGTLQQFAHDKELFEAKSQIARDAKALLQKTSYEKTVIVHSYSSDRAKALELLNYVKIMLKQKLQSSADTKTVVQLSKVADAYSAISKNGNVRIQMLKVVV